MSDSVLLTDWNDASAGAAVEGLDGWRLVRVKTSRLVESLRADPNVRAVLVSSRTRRIAAVVSRTASSFSQP